LKAFDETVYKAYVFEQYNTGDKPEQKAVRPVKKALKKTAAPFSLTRQFERLATRLDKLPTDHMARKYCVERGIAEHKFTQLYVMDMSAALELMPHYKGRITNGPPRLAIPFYNEAGDLTGISLRTLTDEALRYIILKPKEESEDPLIFGLSKVDKTKTVYVTEGAIDSLFLPNAIACNGTSFGKLDQLDLPKEKLVVIIDNQPRNKEVCRAYEKYISLGYKIVIWPTDVMEKDLNDMASAGKDVEKLVRKNIERGLGAQFKFTQWRKCTA
jgi:hypothetical protein